MSDLEKVARAIEDAMASDDNAPRDLARAAVEALREPSEGMVNAGYIMVRQVQGGWKGKSLVLRDRRAVEAAHSAMIDHILKEG